MGLKLFRCGVVECSQFSRISDTEATKACRQGQEITFSVIWCVLASKSRQEFLPYCLLQRFQKVTNVRGGSNKEGPLTCITYLILGSTAGPLSFSSMA